MTPRTFLITGASKGIGLALSEYLSAQGHNVVGIARQVNGVKFPGKLVSLDLGDDKETKSKIADLVQEYAFDGVINNVALLASSLRFGFVLTTVLSNGGPFLSYGLKFFTVRHLQITLPFLILIV